jgi:hypothetical protein
MSVSYRYSFSAPRILIFPWIFIGEAVRVVQCPVLIPVVPSSSRDVQNIKHFNLSGPFNLLKALFAFFMSHSSLQTWSLESKYFGAIQQHVLVEAEQPPVGLEGSLVSKPIVLATRPYPRLVVNEYENAVPRRSVENFAPTHGQRMHQREVTHLTSS